jgi:hypothetical protein
MPFAPQGQAVPAAQSFHSAKRMLFDLIFSSELKVVKIDRLRQISRIRPRRFLLSQRNLYGFFRKIGKLVRVLLVLFQILRSFRSSASSSCSGESSSAIFCTLFSMASAAAATGPAPGPSAGRLQLGQTLEEEKLVVVHLFQLRDEIRRGLPGGGKTQLLRGEVVLDLEPPRFSRLSASLSISFFFATASSTILSAIFCAASRAMRIASSVPRYSSILSTRS